MISVRQMRFSNHVLNVQQLLQGLPGGPVVKTSPSNAGGAGSIPGPGAKIPRAIGPKNQNIKQKQCCNKFNKDLEKKTTNCFT